jgi:hypothetical protein
LLRIAKIPNLTSIAFPWMVGCGLAGGDWKNYLGELNNFTQFVGSKGVKVSLYQQKEK